MPIMLKIPIDGAAESANQPDAGKMPIATNGEAQRPDSKSAAFFRELSERLGMSHRAEGGNSELPDTFGGPSGTICRIETRRTGGRLLARPQLLLPLGGTEIDSVGAERLLSIQDALLNQLGWVLGQSREGLLQMSPNEWTPLARQVASDLDLGSAAACMVMQLFQQPVKSLAGSATEDAGTGPVMTAPAEESSPGGH